VEDAIRQAYRLKFRGYRDLKWRGLDIGEDTKAGCFSPDEQLNAGNLRYDQEDQGRSPLRVIVGVAVQLGIEQGRRIEREKREPWERIRKILETVEG